MEKLFASTLLFLFVVSAIHGQTITTSIPSDVDSVQTYLFYLHGGVVQQQGVNAVSSYYGAYEYLGILDTLSSYGYQVISEARPRHTDEVEYARKVAMQIDTLLQLGASPQHIVVVGASQGAYIALETASQIKKSSIKYAVLGLCSDYALDYFSDYGRNLFGKFLSIYESSDSKGSCESIFKYIPAESAYREVKLNMGIDHAFLFKPYQEWVQPLVQWIDNQN